jgi:hypothetical protein
MAHSVIELSLILLLNSMMQFSCALKEMAHSSVAIYNGSCIACYCGIAGRRYFFIYRIVSPLSIYRYKAPNGGEKKPKAICFERAL